MRLNLLHNTAAMAELREVTTDRVKMGKGKGYSYVVAQSTSQFAIPTILVSYI